MLDDGLTIADGEDGADGVALEAFLAYLQGQLDEGVDDLRVKALAEFNAFCGDVVVKDVTDLDLHEGVDGFSDEAGDADGDVVVLYFFAGGCGDESDFDAFGSGIVIGGNEEGGLFLFAKALQQFFRGNCIEQFFFARFSAQLF